MIKQKTFSRSKQKLNLKYRHFSGNIQSQKVKITGRQKITTKSDLKENNKVKELIKNDCSEKNQQIVEQNGKLKYSKLNSVQIKQISQILRLIKYERTVQQSILLQKSDKTKLIFWNSSLQLNGKQKYFILSADLLLNQDCFWQKQKRTSSQILINSQFIKDWRTIHSLNNGQRNVIIWLVRKQSAYRQLIELVRGYELPLDGVFYTRRKRGNDLVEINTIIKHVYRSHFNFFIEGGGSGNKSEQKMVKTKNKNFITKMLPPRVKNFQSSLSVITNRLQKNDQNSLNSFNSANTLKGIGERRYKKSIDNIVFISQKAQQTDQDKDKEQTYKKSVTSSQSDNYFEQVTTLPNIYFIEGIKCNKRGNCDISTYKGKIPLIFNDIRVKHQKVILRMKQMMNMKDKSNDISEKQLVEVCYFNYEGLEVNPISLIVKIMRRLLLKKQKELKDNFLYKKSEINEYLSTIVKRIITEQNYGTMSKRVSMNLLSCVDQPQLTQSQQEKIDQKIVKKIEEMKKKMIDEIIRLKGRNYMFENGTSVYYFVGDIFKRNYGILYDELYEGEMKELRGKQRDKEKSKICTNDKNKQKQQMNQVEIQRKITENTQFKLERLTFYEFRNEI